ncbi:alpha/beta fold hydrolase [Chryseolinea soli]|uniref:Serine hydrolase family protein n=1 Tax=Chryseolinea soli TaxID=2321403 RepID=A0A385SN79_9BACT|nr:alpha/beta fold hydrolase [Chryseolinea soli]AYB31811.1 serine hydrolase family protein [Chryseolinea soli]
MKKQVLFVHCGGTQGPNCGSRDLVDYLKGALGAPYDVLYPQMPDPDNPQYALWKHTLQEALHYVGDNIILVGHSLGGSVLMKFLSEEVPEKNIAGLFLVAPPFFSSTTWAVDDFIMQDCLFQRLQQVEHIFLYHSRDDEVVPVSHQVLFSDRLPTAAVRELAEGGHLFTGGIEDLVDDIKTLHIPETHITFLNPQLN